MPSVRERDSARFVQETYARVPDPPLADVFRAAGAVTDTDTDDALADLIELDARARLDRGLPVTIERYMTEVPRLETRRIALDAAIEFAMRWAVRKGKSEREAAAEIVRRHPKLAPAVNVAVGLNEGIASTMTLVDMVRGRAALKLPCDFGPKLPDGRARYDVRDRVGSGTQGDVYLAADRALAEPDKPAWVAIKRLNAKSMVDVDRAAFAEEARKARRIDHPCVVRVLDRGEDESGGEYVIYEYVQGGDLSAAVASRGGPMPARDAAALMEKVCRGVHAAHVAGVVHCDLKPSNILLTRNSEPKVADFGVATRLAAEGEKTRGPIGNLAFIAPEQYRGDEGALTSPADVYALGGILYYLLTNKLPNGNTPEEIAARHARTESVAAPEARTADASIDDDLSAICARALSPDPRQRQQSAEALAEDLRAWIEQRPIEWLKPTTGHRVRLFVRRQPMTAAAVAAALVLALAGVGTTVYTAMAAKQEQMREQMAAMKKAAEDEAKNFESIRQSFSGFAGVLKLQSKGQLYSEWFPPVTILESLMGPVLFDPRTWSQTKPSVDLWSERGQVIREFIDGETAAGRGSSLEVAMWLDTLAFWSVRAGKVAEAERALEEGDRAWAGRLSNTDSWAISRRGLRAALASVLAERNVTGATDDSPQNTPATTGRAGAPSYGPPSPSANASLMRAESVLKASIKELEQIKHHGTVRSTLVARLARLYQPDLLNKADELRELEKHEQEQRNENLQMSSPQAGGGGP